MYSIRTILKWFSTFVVVLILQLQNLYADPSRGNFYDSVKYYDFSKTWCCDSVLNLEYLDGTMSGDPKKFAFSEPLGIIGNNYQRFYIHFISVKKSKENPYKYIVTGKTRVKNNICPFEGTITIDTARAAITQLKPGLKIKTGTVSCSCVFRENKNTPNSGVITGILQTDWVLHNRQVHYDNIMGVADGYSNNEFRGTWSSYSEKLIKKCNWGNERIPDCSDLDTGAGEFSPSEQYLSNGWQSYRNQFGNTATAKKARAAECVKWWK